MTTARVVLRPQDQWASIAAHWTLRLHEPQGGWGEVRLRDLRSAYSRHHQSRVAAGVAIMMAAVEVVDGGRTYRYGDPHDLQRGAHRYVAHGRYEQARQEAARRAVERELDRLVSRYGANTRLAELIGRVAADRADHRIGSDQAAPATRHTSNAVHGGDGNSGEVDHLAEKSAQRDGGGAPMDGSVPAVTPDAKEGSDGARTDSQEAGGAERPSTPTTGGVPARQGDRGGDEPTAGMGSQPCASQSCGDTQIDDGPVEIPAAAAETERARTIEGRAAEDAGALSIAIDQPDLIIPADDQVPLFTRQPGAIVRSGAINVPARARARYGAVCRSCANGWLGEFAAAISSHRGRPGRLARALATAICPAGDTSPRWDATALVREMVSRRWAVERCRRLELAPRCIVALDVSTSTAMRQGSALREEIYATVAQLPHVAPEVTVVTYSNTHPQHVYGAALRDNEEITADEEWWAWVAICDPRPIVFLGDVQGAPAMDAVASVRRRAPLVVDPADYGSVEALIADLQRP
ncbi:MAG: hypothetical protein D6682_02405 [Zetaproteobacteria bacterium]|nr:MAG: hypothetical protein D6682_02405 [Zetaproteobacteria bacterium]